MKKFRNICLTAMTVLLSIIPSITVTAESAVDPINIYMFYGSTCPHCEDAMAFLDSLSEEEKSKFNLIKYEVWDNAQNYQLMDQVAEIMGDDNSNLGVPYIVIGNESIIGYADDYSEELITDAIDEAYNSNDRYDVLNDLDISNVTAEYSDSSENNDIVTIIAVAVIAIGIVGLLIFAKIKTK